MNLAEFIFNNFGRIASRTGEHVVIALSALFLALLVAVPLGILLTRQEHLAKPVLGLGNIIMTIPSLALLAFMLPVLGIGNRPAIAALFLYALMPIMRNTYTGIKQVQPSLIEAARGMGLRDFQILYQLELPLAFSFILAGIRTTLVILIGWATLAAFIGGGGLGQLIWAGLTNINYNLALAMALPLAACQKKSETVTLKIGAQNYAEVITLAYMAEALIEDQSDYEVEVVPRLGSVVVLDQAMQTGDVDIASLYFTGGASGLLHPDIVKQVEDINDPKWRDAAVVFAFVRETSRKTLGREWLEPLGYENTYAITVRREMAEQYNLDKVSDLKGLSQDLIIGMDDAYMDRAIDGYQPLLKLYDLDPFAKTATMQINLLYQAIRDQQVDVGVAYSSDARIYAYDLVWLEDDRNLYPPFEAAFAINLSALEKAPGIDTILSQLSGQIDIDTIRQLNYEVDINQRDHKEVALEFLKERKILD